MSTAADPPPSQRGSNSPPPDPPTSLPAGATGPPAPSWAPARDGVCRAAPDAAPLPPIGTAVDPVGRFRGIQGENNSCYADATLMCLFAQTTAFDDCLDHPHDKPPDVRALRHLLRYNVVEPLRRDGFVPRELVAPVRRVLQQCLGGPRYSSEAAAEQEDACEFLNLLGRVLGRDALSCRVVMPPAEPVGCATVGDLVASSGIPLPAQGPLIVNVPRGDRRSRFRALLPTFALGGEGGGRLRLGGMVTIEQSHYHAYVRRGDGAWFHYDGMGDRVTGRRRETAAEENVPIVERADLSLLEALDAQGDLRRALECHLTSAEMAHHLRQAVDRGGPLGAVGRVVQHPFCYFYEPAAAAEPAAAHVPLPLEHLTSAEVVGLLARHSGWREAAQQWSRPPLLAVAAVCRCPACNAVFPTQDAMTRHYASCTAPSARPDDRKCGRTSPRRRVAPGAERYFCPECQVQVMSREEMATHCRGGAPHPGAGSASCPACQAVLPTEDAMMRHYAQCGADSARNAVRPPAHDVTSYPCPTCREVLPTEAAMLRHFEKCGAASTTASQPRDAAQQWSRPPTPHDGGSTYRCPDCGLSHATEAAMLLHLQNECASHGGGGDGPPRPPVPAQDPARTSPPPARRPSVYPCPGCRTPFPSEEAMVTHPPKSGAALKDRPLWQCPACALICSTKDELQSHLTTHGGVHAHQPSRPAAAPQQRAPHTSQALVVSGTAVLKCSHCGKVSPSKNAAMEHAKACLYDPHR